MSCCCCCVGCCICGYIAHSASKITRNLEIIGDEFAGARVALVQATFPTALTADAMAFDQYGQSPQSKFRKGGEMKPCWPPLGYNIILKAPTTFDLQRVWPKSLSTGGMLPTVGQTHMPVVPASMVMPV